MIASIHTAAVNGLTATPVDIEVSTRPGGPEMQTVFLMAGLPDNAVKESRIRVTNALTAIGISLTPSTVYSVNFAPANIRKEGSGYDLPLSLALLAAAGRIRPDRLGSYAFVGELGLDGTIRPVKGALSIAIKVRALGLEGLIVPKENEREAAVVNRLKVFGAATLTDVLNHLNGIAELPQVVVDTRAEFLQAQSSFPLDFYDVKGQTAVKRAFEVAAAGGHNIILIGSPGCGKSMIAKRLPSILPPLTLAESLETTQIHSIAGSLQSGETLLKQRPFRAPHHTISDVALIGGGIACSPGEISMAHNGVLFLDELPEFSRSALETLRQPLEDREITISRAKYTATLPCNFMLAASMNPCPCGYYNHPTHQCHCTPLQRLRYKGKISGPLLDRIDIQIEVTPVPVSALAEAPSGEHSEDIRRRVIAARDRQTARYRDVPGIHCNAQMTRAMLERYATLDEESNTTLTRAMKRLDLSARAYDRILRVARTIADLEGADQISSAHIKEAVSYRNLDRGDWGQ